MTSGLRPLATLAGSCLLLAGCDDAPSEPAHTVTTATDSDGVQTTTTTLGTDAGTATLQARKGGAVGLPLGLPLYPDADVTRRNTFARGETRTHFIELLSEAKPRQIVSFYEAAAARQGLAAQRGLPAGDEPMLHAKGAQGAQLTLTTARTDDGPVVVQITITETR